MKSQEWTRVINLFDSSNVRISILYGTSECQTVICCHLADLNDVVVPMGYPLPGVDCLLIDEQGQTVNPVDNPNHIGEIHIGGENYSF